MEKCYEYFQCNEVNCPIRKLKRLDCWNVEGTRCGAYPEGVKGKIAKSQYCHACLYYKQTHYSQMQP